MADKPTRITWKFPSIRENKNPPFNYSTPLLPAITQSAFSQSEMDRATKRNLPVEEYRSRVASVAQAFRTCLFNVGDTVYPSSKADRDRYGKMMVSNICKHYDDYGDVSWTNPPLILVLTPLKDRTQFVNANTLWCVRSANAVEVPADEC